MSCHAERRSGFAARPTRKPLPSEVGTGRPPPEGTPPTHPGGGHPPPPGGPGPAHLRIRAANNALCEMRPAPSSVVATEPHGRSELLPGGCPCIAMAACAKWSGSRPWRL